MTIIIVRKAYKGKEKKRRKRIRRKKRKLPAYTPFSSTIFSM
jgi:hypothetical protein